MLLIIQVTIIKFSIKEQQQQHLMTFYIIEKYLKLLNCCLKIKQSNKQNTKTKQKKKTKTQKTTINKNITCV